MQAKEDSTKKRRNLSLDVKLRGLTVHYSRDYTETCHYVYASDNLYCDEADSFTLADHNGKFFKNLQEMCDYHGISYGCFYQRMKAGYSLEESLTGIGVKSRGRKKPCIDHLGNRFATVNDRCDCYGIPVNIFYARIRDGYTLKEALTEAYHKSCKKRKSSTQI